MEHPTSPLAFGGAVIHDRGDMLSLTDMWRAAGADDAKRPAEWLRQDATKAFAEVVAGTLDMGHAHIYSKRGGRGIGGVTFAHWQIALAYAKYLSPEFHMWCNTVVRERMEGKSISTASPWSPSLWWIMSTSDRMAQPSGRSRKTGSGSSPERTTPRLRGTPLVVRNSSRHLVAETGSRSSSSPAEAISSW